METARALSVLSGLSQETRLGIFRLLVEVGHEGLSAGDIASRLALPPTTLSFHLKNMSHAGLVRCQRQGTTKVYSADFDAMNGLVEYLTANCCGGEMSACKPKTKSQKRRRATAAR